MSSDIIFVYTFSHLTKIESEVSVDESPVTVSCIQPGTVSYNCFDFRTPWVVINAPLQNLSRFRTRLTFRLWRFSLKVSYNGRRLLQKNLQVLSWGSLQPNSFYIHPHLHRWRETKEAFSWYHRRKEFAIDAIILWKEVFTCRWLNDYSWCHSGKVIRRWHI